MINTKTMKSNLLIVLLTITSSTLFAQNNPITFDPGGGAGGDKFGMKATETGNNTTKLHIYKRFTFDTEDIDRLVIDSGGKVGIGTSTPGSTLNVGTNTTNSPSSLVQFGQSVPNGEARVLSLVNSGGGSDQSTSIDFHNKSTWSSTGRIQLQQLGAETASRMSFHTFNGSLKNQMTLSENGRLGIGTSSPASKLDIVNFGEGAELLRLSTERPWVFRQTSTGATTQLDLHSTVDSKNFKITSPQGIRSAQFLVSNTEESNRVFLVPDGGKVGIGTQTPDSDALLTVKGAIHSIEIKVLANAGVPDYVFEPNYVLPTLKEIKKFITDHRHLPEIPSAAEMEVNGIDLGDMNMRLLKKIEELTLYQIELLERIEKLESKQKE